MISYFDICPSLAGADIPSAQRADAIDYGEGGSDRDMDYAEERDFADQGPLTDMDMEEDARILATLLERIPWPLAYTQLTLSSYCKTFPCRRQWQFQSKWYRRL